MPNQYLVIYEDGSSWTEPAITDGIRAAWEAGVVTVFCFSPEVGFQVLHITEMGEDSWIPAAIAHEGG